MKKNKMKERIMCLVLAVMLGISGIIPTAPVLKTEAASLSAADDSQTVIGCHRLHDTSYAAVQVGNKIYYSSDRTGYIFCYDVKKKTNKKLAKLPKQVRNKNTYYSYKCSKINCITCHNFYIMSNVYKQAQINHYSMV